MRTSRIVPQAACGAVIGLLAGGILMSISAPRYSEVAVSLAQAEVLDRVTRVADLFGALARWGVPLLIAAFSTWWVLVARGLSAALPPFPFHKAPKPGTAWAAVLLAGAALAFGVSCWTFTGLVGVEGFGELGRGASTAIDYAIASFMSAVFGAAAWLILGRWAGEYSAWRRPAEAFSRGWQRDAALGAAFSIALPLGMIAVERLFLFLFALNIEVWNPSLEVNDAALKMNVWIVAGLGAAFFGAAGGLADGLAPGAAPAEERARRARPALVLVGVVALGAIGLHRHAVARHQWRAGGLPQAARLPDSVPPIPTLVTLAFDKTAHASVKEWPLWASASGWMSSGKVAATAANSEALRKFVEGPGKTSRFRGQALDALPAIEAALWEPARSYAAQRSAYEIPSLYASVLERIWIQASAPITPENRARLEELSDESKYRLPAKAATVLAKAWLRFGELDRARLWREKSDKPEEVVIPAKPPLTDGRVRGRFAVDGKAAAGLRVGLFRLNDTVKRTPEIYPGRGGLTRIVEARTTDAGGAFEFARVAQGRYYLALLAPAWVIKPAGPVRAAPHPGIVSLDRARPRAELETINLTTRR